MLSVLSEKIYAFRPVYKRKYNGSGRRNLREYDTGKMLPRQLTQRHIKDQHQTDMAGIMHVFRSKNRHPIQLINNAYQNCKISDNISRIPEHMAPENHRTRRHLDTAPKPERFWGCILRAAACELARKQFSGVIVQISGIHNH